MGFGGMHFTLGFRGGGNPSKDASRQASNRQEEIPNNNNKRNLLHVFFFGPRFPYPFPRCAPPSLHRV